MKVSSYFTEISLVEQVEKKASVHLKKLDNRLLSYAFFLNPNAYKFKLFKTVYFQEALPSEFDFVTLQKPQLSYLHLQGMPRNLL